MSGSGSTVYGIFEKEITFLPFTNENYFVKEII
jgi:4-diphosphocytidyl-2C-methyl-D-erythritol kinase